MTTYLESRCEASLIKAFCRDREGIQQVTTDAWVALRLASDDRANICENTIKHLHNGLNRAF